MDPHTLVVRPIGRVESALVDPATAPKQGGEGAPSAWLVFDQPWPTGFATCGPVTRFLSSPGSTGPVATCCWSIPATT